MMLLQVFFGDHKPNSGMPRDDICGDDTVNCVNCEFRLIKGFAR